jgi:DNA-3-methyladenine glycosylase II
MDQISLPHPLNQKSFTEGIAHLCKTDPDLAQIIQDLGNLPFWSREPGFQTLIQIILEQQVSLASAKAAFTKLEKASGNSITPARFLKFTAYELRGFGFSRQKAKYGQTLSRAIINGDFDFGKLHSLDDIAARHTLTTIKGIGPWTADIYLLTAHLRPDIFPSGDLALAKAVMSIKNLGDIPNRETLDEITARWKPWRAVAARILWHYYLS